MSDDVLELYHYQNEIKEKVEANFIPHQIFLNHVDAFNSRYIAAVRFTFT